MVDCFLRENYSATRYYLRALHIIQKICDIWRRSFLPSINLTDENWFAFRKCTPPLHPLCWQQYFDSSFVSKIRYKITSPPLLLQASCYFVTPKISSIVNLIIGCYYIYYVLKRINRKGLRFQFYTLCTFVIESSVFRFVSVSLTLQ